MNYIVVKTIHDHKFDDGIESIFGLFETYDKAQFWINNNNYPVKDAFDIYKVEKPIEFT